MSDLSSGDLTLLRAAADDDLGWDVDVVHKFRWHDSPVDHATALALWRLIETGRLRIADRDLRRSPIEITDLGRTVLS